MANASFCPTCGEITSDGCPELDEFGNETDRTNYSPCQCETGIDSNGRRVEPKPDPGISEFLATLTVPQRRYLALCLHEMEVEV